MSSAAWRVPADSPFPQVHVLSQGDYQLADYERRERVQPMAGVCPDALASRLDPG